jgi:hypothetical protein
MLVISKLPRWTFFGLFAVALMLRGRVHFRFTVHAIISPCPLVATNMAYITDFKRHMTKIFPEGEPLKLAYLRAFASHGNKNRVSAECC